MKTIFYQFIKFLLMSAALVTFACCGNHEYSEYLNQAESVIETLPDSALKILEAIPKLNNLPDSALYGLLSAQAKIKLDRSDIDTAALSKALNFFNEYPDNDFRIRANFYMGYLEFKSKNFAKAVRPIILANLEARDIKSDIWIGRTSTHLALLLNKPGLAKYSVSYDSLAINAFKRLGMTKDYLLSMVDLGMDLASIYKFNESNIVFNRTFEKISKIEHLDSFVMCYLLDNSIPTKMKLNKHDEVDSISHIRDLYSVYSKRSSSVYAYLAEFYAIKGDLSKSKLMLDSAFMYIKNNYERERYNNAKVEVAKALGDEEMRAEAEKELGKITHDSAVEANTNTEAQILNRTIIEYEQKKADAERKSRIIGWSIAAVLLVLSLSILSFYIHRRKKSSKELSRRKAEIEIISGELDSAKKEIENKNAQIEDIEKQFESLKKSYKANKEGRETLNEFKRAYENDIPLIIKLCDSFTEFSGPLQNERARILDLKEKLTDYFSGERLEYLIEIIDAANKSVVTDFRKRNPAFKEIDVTLFALSISGFSGKSISLLTGLSRNTVYQKKRRMIERLKISNPKGNSPYIHKLERSDSL